MADLFLLAWLYSVISFFFSDPATPAIYTLSLHDALPICRAGTSERGDRSPDRRRSRPRRRGLPRARRRRCGTGRSEEHTSELQSHVNLVCRLLLEKKKNASCA